jgi:outer membrane protein TolC
MRKFNFLLVLILIVTFFIIFNPSSSSAQAQEVLTWEKCLSEAAQNNPDLISAQEDISQAQASKAITASGLFPQVSADLAAARSERSESTSNSYAYGASGTQLLFDGFQTSTNVKAATENITATKYQYRFTSSQIRYALRSAFAQLLYAQELIQVTEDIVKIRRDNLILISLSYESGLEHKGALLTAEASLAEAEFERARALRNLEVAQRQLIKEMGRRELTPLRVQGDFAIAPANLEKPDFESIVKTNPSLQQLMAKENVAALGIKSAYANFFPEVSAQAGVGKTDSKWAPSDDQWNVGLSFSVPLFEGGLRNAQVDQAKAVFRQAQAKTKSTSNSVITTLESTWAILQDAAQDVDVQRKTLLAAQERSKIAGAQYGVGFISYDDWSIIEDNLVQYKKAYLNAQVKALLAEAQWIQAKGETLEYAK